MRDLMNELSERSPDERSGQSLDRPAPVGLKADRYIQRGTLDIASAHLLHPDPMP